MMQIKSDLFSASYNALAYYVVPCTAVFAGAALQLANILNIEFSWQCGRRGLQ